MVTSDADIGRVLRTRRETLSLTQQELASRLQIPVPSVISLFEDGKRTIPLDLLPQYAKILAMPARPLIYSWLQVHMPSVAEVLCGTGEGLPEEGL